jgi:NAD(P)-dependent dehydrogenase (short-subunit alcohol dehydrogenase family)
VLQLEGKVVWVTGGGSGIGEAAALALAREGAAIVLTGRREAPLEEVAARIRELGGTAYIQPGDLTEPRPVRRIGDFIRDELGRLDILLNNAGININDRHWDKLTPENALLMINGNPRRRNASPSRCRSCGCGRTASSSTPPRWLGASSAASRVRSTPPPSTASSR